MQKRSRRLQEQASGSDAIDPALGTRHTRRPMPFVEQGE